MSIEDKVDKLLSDFSEHRGESRQFNQNMTNWVSALNVKINTHIDAHAVELKEETKEVKKDSQELWNKLMAAGMLALSAAEVFHLYKGR